MCVHACPFGNAVWDEASTKVLKCDYCAGDPACAKFCPTGAIEWVDDVAATQGRKRAFAAKFKEAFTELGSGRTKPCMGGSAISCA